jgi:murein DD-endopeptidase MepM/ murein hydrolase activator NlpD
MLVPEKIRKMNFRSKKIIDIKKVLVGAFLAFVLILGVKGGYNVLAYQDTSVDGEIEEIEKDITDQQKAINELKAKAEKYEKMIRDKQLQIDSLDDQISVLNNRIAKKEIDIEITQSEIKNTQDKIKQKNIEIKAKIDEIEVQKEKIIEFIKLIYKNDQRSYLEILILNESFSEFFNYLTFTENIEYKLKDILDELIILKEKLEEDKDMMEREKQNLEDLDDKLAQEKDKLDEEKEIKETILRETRYSERLFKQLLSQAKEEQINADRDILQLEREKRDLLKKQELEINLLIDSAILSWPVDPSRGITATFHDPDYPYRHLFEHPAIDLRVSQSTPIKSPANAYVGRVRDNGMGYSYIMLIHDNGLSTVYGHVSKILVEEDEFITRGQIIGRSGGAPGTPGAGRLTTGAHLHFEVRLNGIPVNPLDYLP